MGSHEHDIIELDMLLVGAGFGGVYQLKKLRDLGYKVRLVEAGSDYGGVWHWNRYPGARVDSPVPLYEFDDPNIWRDWNWKRKFPGSEELRAYFSYVADRWDLRDHTQFNTFVTSATWIHEESKWIIHTHQGQAFKAQFFLLNTGFVAKRYIPDWKGIDSFRGIFLHPSYWPENGLDMKGKRVGLIGTGATGIQIAQELAHTAGELVIFQRTPSLSLPMGQVNYEDGDQGYSKESHPKIFSGRLSSFGGLDFNFLGRSTFDDAEETRLEVYEHLWRQGDFKYWLANYQDMLFDKKANEEAYRFWRDKTRPRIKDPRTRDLVAPMEQPYAFGCKRVPLENGFYDILNNENVQLVDVNATPIEEVTSRGLKTSEKEWDFDLIICATGYDTLTGGLAQIDIRGASGESLREHWEKGTYTYLGLSCAGFPNMFFGYGPQAPTPFCNGPTCAQVQGDWIAGVFDYMRRNQLRVIEAERKSEEEWRQSVFDLANSTLLPTTKSWYMGDNIPGKLREPYFYLGGLPQYHKILRDLARHDYTGFKLC